MKRAFLAAATTALLGAVLVGSAAQGQSTRAPGQSTLAPGTATAPAERPEAPATAPAPEPTPEAPTTAPVPEQTPQAPATSPPPEETPEPPAASPLPPEDPDVGAEAPAEAPAPAKPPVPEQLAEDDAELAACLGRLRALGTAFERVDAVGDQGGACGIVNPVRITQIVPGVALEPADVIRCATAAALAEWVATFVLPASRLLPDRGPLAGVAQVSTYVCRPIDGDGELSQHAFGNAVDIGSFRFAEGPPIPVEPREAEGTAAAAFQRTARASACLGFTTVLGPGQHDHDDHLHLDIEARRSGYQLCQ
jgi:hypothetical protein